MTDKCKVPNQLIDEKSPYLLQHAYNPVNWYPWGEVAFKKAKEENKPIFLSIGYSTCHWCHVMEKESFEDEEVCDLLNKSFISIKVDREERPDIDSIYMQVCQALNGSGGWPLTIMITPQQIPFFAATYIPKRAAYGRSGLIDILTVISYKWQNEKSELEEAGASIQEYIISNSNNYDEPNVPKMEMIKSSYELFSNIFDKEYGGFGYAPKFPTPHNLLFLLHYFVLENDINALKMSEKTLVQMYKGGIFDHIGGGFSRYSTDEKWLVPHFEKMLYDNAGLSYAYLTAYNITKTELFKYVAKRIFDYVLNEMTDVKCGFYCSQDADSEGVEGKYYVFTPEEVNSVLDREDSKNFCSRYNITANGNFEGKSIPNLLKTNSDELIDNNMNEILDKLYNYRIKRMRLHKDDKILTSWNGYMIASFCKAYRVLMNDKYLLSAKKAWKFIYDNLTDKEGRLYVRWRDGESVNEGHIDDYAFYVWASLELYESTLEIYYLKESVRLSKIMLNKFFDNEKGGFYLYSKDAQPLISRPKELYDGAMPSGNSVAAYDLCKLYKITGDMYWKEMMDKQLNFLAGNFNENGMGNSFALLSFLEVLYPSKELVYVTKKFNKENISNLIWKIEGLNISVISKIVDNMDDLDEISQYTSDYPVPDNGEAFYLCENGACQKPVFTIEDLLKLV